MDPSPSSGQEKINDRYYRKENKKLERVEKHSVKQD